MNPSFFSYDLRKRKHRDDYLWLQIVGLLLAIVLLVAYLWPLFPKAHGAELEDTAYICANLSHYENGGDFRDYCNEQGT